MVDTAAIPQAPPQGMTQFSGRILSTVASLLWDWSEQERGRFALWIPVIFGFGAATYFSFPFEPGPYVSLGLGLIAISVGSALPQVRHFAIGVGICCAGFLVADMRAALVKAPAIDRPLEYASIVGSIVSIDEEPKQRRLVIDVNEISGLATEDAPARVRISWRGKEFDALPGDKIRISANLSPPPRPAAPGGYDFSRHLYFQKIGAVGFAYSPPQIVSIPDRSLAREISARIERSRTELSRRILAKAQGDSGAIVAAVVTGKRGSISESAEAAFRDSGLAHLLSISGLHMGLATGLIFFAVRAALSLVESVALRYPIKKWAALAALAAGGAYLFVSGAAWPAQRAFLMSSIFFIAILADRRALSLRNVAIAALVILIFTPEAVLHPGFQMSFAAVTSLIAFYEWWSARADRVKSYSALARIRRYFLGIAVTDTIAAAATAPFSLYHFSRAANFGLAANLVSIPLMGFWVMPAAIAAIALMPIGLDGFFWKAAARGVDIMLRLGSWTKELPGAVTVFPHWPPIALGVIAIGGIWLCLMRANWRFFGLASIPLAAIFIIAEPQPSIYFSDDGTNVGVSTVTAAGDRKMAVFDRRKGRFDSEVWMELAGFDIDASKPIKLSDISACDDLGCVVKNSGRLISISSSRPGLDDDCKRADLVIALYSVSDRDKKRCRARLLDVRNAQRDGAHAIFISEGSIRVKTVSERRGVRPWTE